MNFKKCTSLFIAILLLVFNFGIAFNVHYCEGEIVSISSVYTVEKTLDTSKIDYTDKDCCASKTTHHKQCCKDKVVNLEDKSSQKIIKTFSFQINFPFVLQDWKPLLFNEILTLSRSEKAVYYCDASATPLFKLYNKYIFYA